MKQLYILLLLLTFTLSAQAQLEKWTLTEIVDGDTIYAKDSTGTEIKFRLIGMDTPESRHPFKPVEEYAHEATARLTELLHSDIVYIEYDIERLDKYGRTLAYVYNADKVLVNAQLIKDGFAKITTYPPNVKYVDTYYENLKYAKNEGLGMWSDN